MNFANSFKINNTKVGKNFPVYFIADIAANHDGELERAKKLISLAKDSGADAVKFQHHNVKKYVSDFGFKSLGNKFSHQKKWKKSIFEVYKDAQVPTDWTSHLSDYCKKINIDFFSTPYDLEMVDHLESFNVPAYKIGSGDVSWYAMLKKVASTTKPIIIASGASTIEEVEKSMAIISDNNQNIVLMQCNTNYTASIDNFKFINLNVLQTYKKLFPNVVLGLSDHTHGDVTVLGAVALGARIIEKHFTDDNERVGPDHIFSMNPYTWKEMIDKTRLLEAALGSSVKKIEDNEKETVILQRRCIRVTKDLEKHDMIDFNNIEFQRPAPEDSLNPNEIERILNKKINKSILKGDYLKKENIIW